MTTKVKDQATPEGLETPVSEFLQGGTGEQSSLLQLIADAMPALISYIDGERRYRFINKEYEKWFGLTQEETVGRTISELLGKEAQKKVEPYVRRVLAGEDVRFEAEIQYQKAGRKWVEARYIPDFDESGSARGFFALIVDITERKDLEAKTLEQFEELENIYSSVPVGLAVIDTELRFVRVNEWLARLNGISAPAHAGRPVSEVVPQLAEKAREVLREVLETGEPVRDVIIEGVAPGQPAERKAWSEIWTPVRNVRGETIAVSVVVEDVTESRWAESLMAEQNRLFGMIAAGRPVATVLTELTAVIDRLHPSSRSAVLVADRARCEFEAAYAANIPDTYTAPLKGVKIEETPLGTCCAAVYRGEAITCTNVESDTRWMEGWRELCLRHGIKACHSEPIVGEDGRPLGTVVLGFDTAREPDDRGLQLVRLGAQVAGVAIERARAEATLRLSEERLRLATAAADIYTWEYDPSTGLSVYSPNMRSVLGFALPTNSGNANLYIHPHDRDRVLGDFAACLDGHKMRSEYRLVDPANGETAWVATHGTLIPTNGRPARAVGITQNITERKRAEGALRAAHDTFRLLVENSPFGIYVVDADFRLAQVSAGAQKVFKNVRPLIGRDFAEVLRFIWEEPFATEAINLFRRTLETGEPYHSPRTVETRGDVDEVESYDWRIERIAMPDGRFGVVCHFYDLSERLHYEEALRASEERYRFLDTLGEATRTATDPATVMAAATRLLGEHLAVARCAYADVEADNDRFTIRDDWRAAGVATTAGVYSLDLFGTRAAAEMRAGRELVIRDVDTELAPDDGGDTFNAIGIKAIICFPLVKEGELRAMMAVHNAVPRDWTEGEVALVREATERSWAHIERIASSAALRESEKRYRAVVETQSEMICRFRLDGTILFTNDAYARSIGTPVESLAGDSFWNHIPKEDHAVVRAMLDSLTPEEPVVRIENRFGLEGDVRWTMWTNRALSFDGSGRVAEAQSTGVDITERKRAEEQLAEQKRLYQSITDNATTALFIMDERQQCTFMNPAAEKLTGYTHDETFGRPLHDVVHHKYPDGRDYPLSECPIDQAFPTRNQMHGEETFVHKDGHFYNVAFTASPLPGPEGSTVGTVIEVIDITERKHAEAALRESEERYRGLVNQTVAGIAEVDLTGRFVTANDQYCEMLGYTRDELLAMRMQEITHPDDLPDNLAHLQSLATDGTPFEIEKRYVREDGSIVWVHNSVSAIRDELGRPQTVAAVSIDITERKRTEEALRSQTELLRGITESTPDLIYAKDASGRLIMANKATLDAMGQTEESAIGHLDSELYDPLEADLVMANDRRVMQTGRTETMEERVSSRGETHTYLTTKNPLRDAEGRVIGVVGISHDITALKRAETALRDSEMRHRLALESGNMGTWTMPLDGRPCWADEQTLALFDIPAEEWAGDAALIRARRLPEDQEKVNRTLAKAIEERSTWRSEFRVRRRDGSIRWLAGVGRIEFGPRGEPVLMRGINFDITDRKLAEEELRSYHEILEATVRERTSELAEANRELKNENRQRRLVEVERQRLMRQLVAAQEHERRRIAQDLHDHLGQQLTALNLKLELALRAAADGPARHLRDAKAMMRQIDDDVDALAWQLRPAILDDDGFLPALRNYVEDWSRRCGVPAELWADAHFESRNGLSPEAETNLYRITQEALNNVAKYARADRVEVLLNKRDDSAVLTVQDDGAGFDVAAAAAADGKSMGLIGMRERADMVGGTFQVESSPGEGTTVYVRVPFASEKEVRE